MRIRDINYADPGCCEIDRLKVQGPHDLSFAGEPDNAGLGSFQNFATFQCSVQNLRVGN